MTGSVLLVDDDPEFRALETGVLRGWGVRQVFEAGTVSEALIETARHEPETVLVDIRLPDGNGYTLATELTARERSPRVVLISSDSDAGDDVRAERVGALGFVAKHELIDGRLRLLIGTR
jgi:two-component system nitrate/nitrite response regulator NarL